MTSHIINSIMTSRIINSIMTSRRRDGVRSGRVVARGDQLGRDVRGDAELRFQDQLPVGVGEDGEGEAPPLPQVAQVVYIYKLLK